MNPYHNPVITYIKSASEYESECELESKKLSELSQQEESDLLGYLLGRNNPLTKKTLEYNGLLYLEEIKEKKGLTFTNKDKFYFLDGWSMKGISQDEKLSDYQLDKIKEGTCYVAVQTPKLIQDQIDARQKRKEQKKKLTEEQKLARKLKKAEKILREAGKL